MNPHLRACVALVLRDLRSAARRPGDVATPLFFFVVVSALFAVAKFVVQCRSELSHHPDESASPRTSKSFSRDGGLS